MVQQIFVDSRDRISGTSTDFSIQLPTTLVVEGGAHKCRVDNLRIPMVFPTITTGVNDTFTVKEAATSYTVTLAGGNYDGATLAADLQALLFAAAPGTWTVTYDSSNIAMTVSCTNNFHHHWGHLRSAIDESRLHTDGKFVHIHLCLHAWP